MTSLDYNKIGMKISREVYNSTKQTGCPFCGEQKNQLDDHGATFHKTYTCGAKFLVANNEATVEAICGNSTLPDVPKSTKDGRGPHKCTCSSRTILMTGCVCNGL